MSERARLYLILLNSTLIVTAFMGSRVTVPLFAIKLGASTATVGVLMSLFAILPMLLSLQTGRWIDRVGTALPMIGSAAAIALLLVAGYLIPALWMLYVLSAGVGLAVAVFSIASVSVAGAIGPAKERTAIFSWLALAGAAGTFVGSIVAGYLIDSYGHAAALAALALAPALAAALVAGRRYSRTPRERPAREPGKSKVFDLLRLPTVRAALLVGSLMGASWDVYAFLIPVYGTSIGLSAASIGNIMGATGLAMFLVRLGLPPLMRLFDEWQLVIASMFCCALVFVLFPFASTNVILIGLSLLFGAAFGAVQPIVNALLFNASPAGRIAEVSGLRSTVQNGLHTAMPALFGVLGAALGVLPMFWSMGALLGVGGWLSKTRWSRYGADREPRQDQAQNQKRAPGRAGE